MINSSLTNSETFDVFSKFLTGPKAPGGSSIPNNYCTKCHGSNKKIISSGSPRAACRCTSELKPCSRCVSVCRSRVYVGVNFLVFVSSDSGSPVLRPS